MPEAYTHIRTAQRALHAAGFSMPHPAAFAIGAQGPDLLFCYRVWKKGRRPDLPALGGRMHHERTGAFLRALCRRAATESQISYAMGFLCHYATDCVLHPYVGAITQLGQLYGKKGGHGYFEAALDSLVHQQDFGSRAVARSHACPLLSPVELAEIDAQLQGAVNEVYGLTVERQPFADSYHHTRALRAIFVSRLKISYGIFWLAERAAFGGPGFITGHVTPARMKKDLPACWKHPANGEEIKMDLGALLKRAEEESLRLLKAFQARLQGEISQEEFFCAVGDNSYETGLPLPPEAMGEEDAQKGQPE